MNVNGMTTDFLKKCVIFQFTSETYEKDLQEALLQSKLEFEKEKLEGPKSGNNAESGSHSRGDKKKKKQKEKPTTMSLEEFNQLDEESKAVDVVKSKSQGKWHSDSPFEYKSLLTVIAMT
jgi:hypothetical protein